MTGGHPPPSDELLQQAHPVVDTFGLKIPVFIRTSLVYRLESRPEGRLFPVHTSIIGQRHSTNSDRVPGSRLQAAVPRRGDPQRGRERSKKKGP